MALAGAGGHLMAAGAPESAEMGSIDDLYAGVPAPPFKLSVEINPAPSEDALAALAEALSAALADGKPPRIRPADPLTVQLPGSMAAPGRHHHAELTREWRPVFGSLQAKITGKTGGVVQVAFRIDPWQKQA